MRFHPTRQIDLYAATGIFINPKYFRDGKISITARIFTKEIEEAQDAEAKYHALTAAITKAYNEADKSTITAKWLTDTITAIRFPQATEEPATEEQNQNLIPAIELYLQAHDFSIMRVRHFHVLSRCLRRYELWKRWTDSDFSLSYDSITAETLGDFKNYLIEEHSFCTDRRFKAILKSVPESREPQPRGSNTIIQLFSKFNAFWTWSIKQGYTQNRPFENFDFGSEKYGTPYYLTIAERNALYALDLSDTPRLERERDRFVFQCCVGCRVGDLLRLKKQHVSDGVLTYIPGKTKAEKPVTLGVPLNRRARCSYRLHSHNFIIMQ